MNVIRPNVGLEEVNEGSNEMTNLNKRFADQNIVCLSLIDFKWTMGIIDFVMEEDSSIFKANKLSFSISISIIVVQVFYKNIFLKTKKYFVR